MRQPRAMQPSEPALLPTRQLSHTRPDRQNRLQRRDLALTKWATDKRVTKGCLAVLSLLLPIAHSPRYNPSMTAPQQAALTSVSVDEALESILAYFSPLEPVPVDLSDALGMVLAEDISSDIDLPPFDNSSMDGYAVIAEDVAGATAESPASLRVAGYLPAGAAPGPGDRVERGTAFRIMTGAPLPPGADAVVPFENTDQGRTLAAPGLQPQDSRAEQTHVGGDVFI